jgi:hypothetical protein
VPDGDTLALQVEFGVRMTSPPRKTSALSKLRLWGGHGPKNGPKSQTRRRVRVRKQPIVFDTLIHEIQGSPRAELAES